MSFTCQYEGCPDFGFTFRYPGMVLEPGKGRREMTPTEDAEHHHATVHRRDTRRTLSRKPLVDDTAA